MSPYSKPFLDIPSQITLLQSRGLEITDLDAAQNCLRHIGYYRLSAYWYPFRVLSAPSPPTRQDQFLPLSRLEDAVALYVYDKKWKLLVMDAIERVEIATRVEISLLLGKLDPLAHLNPAHFRPEFVSRLSKTGKVITPHADWMAKMQTMEERSTDEFASHFRRKYSSPLPIWIACELWDFGMLSWLYSGLKDADRTTIAQRFGISNAKILESWLRALNHCRNIIAHHGRLWNRNLVDYPLVPFKGRMAAFDVWHLYANIEKRVYSILCVLSHFISLINPTSSWKNRVVSLANSFPAMPHARLGDMGFPNDWKTHAFWK